MRKIVAVIVPLLIVGCAGQAMVEVGLNDSEFSSFLLLGTEGDIVMRVLCIEVPQEGAYDTLWSGAQEVAVPINGADFVSITGGNVEISPDSYLRMRLTVDSVRFVDEPTDKMLVDAPYQFTAQAFSAIVIEEGDEFRLVININTDMWFDSNPDSLKIREGHEAFEEAQLKIYYE